MIKFLEVHIKDPNILRNVKSEREVRSLKAVRFLGNGLCDVAQVPDPQSGNGKVLIKAWASALCGSENKSYFADPSTYPADIGYKVPGHEMSGEVVDPGNSTTLEKGDRVVVQIMDGCGECYYCKNGTYQFCEKLLYEGGTHAEYVAMPEKCVIKAPSDIPYDTLVLLGGDTVGVAYRATRQLSLHPGKLVFISGAGPIGLGMIALLKHFGCFVVVSELHSYRKQYAQAHAGADLVLDPTMDDVKSKLRELSGGVDPEIVIECSGNPVAQLQALEYARCNGTVLFVGENYKGLNIVPSVHIIHKELEVRGAFYFTAADFYEIVSLYRRGLRVEGLVSHKVKIDDAPAVISDFSKGLTGKAIIHPQE